MVVRLLSSKVMKKQYITPQVKIVLLVEEMSILDNSLPVSEDTVGGGLAPAMTSAPVDEDVAE